ncbi:GIY-YIG nuclease family protein [Dyella monticola]|uniref:GIY-YIG nuclease family protein n=1 Tax=Dyella monticola TaxID=1927958 RepID=A0A370X9I5_9GAMM|nr:GIY-YIG nuclease family protein [Dyella monticola]RDS84931.1 GIY-YIG nuclease family protein [Dyella monticola]
MSSSEREKGADWDLPRTSTRGRTFVYVLPSLSEDLTKVGFTQDPIQRFRSFHPRFFALFDLEQGMLAEVGPLREARRLERLLIERWPAHRASPPLLVSDAAGGHTEWFRGIAGEVGPFVRRTTERYGYTLHAPLSAWLRARFMERADSLYDWSLRMLAMIEWQAANLLPEARDPRYAQALGDTLDACNAVGMDLAALLAPAVQAWYAAQRGC